MNVGENWGGMQSRKQNLNIQWNKASIFYPFRMGVACSKKGMHLKNALGIYSFKEPKLVLQGQYPSSSFNSSF